MRKPVLTQASRLPLSALLAVAVSLTPAPRGLADEISWQGAAGDWFNVTNWTDQSQGGINVVPGGLDNAYIDNGAGPLITSGNALVGAEYVGYIGTGILSQSGGTNTSSELDLGENGGSTGTYTLSCTGSLATVGISSEYVGFSGTGIFNQSGGTNSTFELDLGEFSGSTGNYTLSGTGSLSITGSNGEYLGLNGTGNFNQTGGTNATSVLSLGSNTGSTGTYTLSGCGQLSADYEYVGFSGAGTFNQSGGTNVTSELDNGIGGGGSYSQTGGTNTISGELEIGTSANDFNGINFKGTGTYTLSGSGWLSAGDECVGRSGTGTFNQTGGTNSLTGTLSIGANAGSNGTYTLSGTGTISAMGADDTGVAEYVGYSGDGIFNQTGGTNNLNLNEGALALGYNAGSNGTYNLSGTGSLIARIEVVGNSGAGIFTQSGGTNIINIGGELDIGAGDGSTGTYTLTGGTLAVHAYVYVGGSSAGAGGTGTFNQTGGTNTIYDTLIVDSTSPSNSSYALSGTGSLSVTGNEIVGYYGAAAFNQSGGINTTPNSTSARMPAP